MNQAEEVESRSHDIPPKLNDDQVVKKHNDHEMSNIKGSKSALKTFILTLFITLLCGSSNDYFGKLIFQLLPDHEGEGNLTDDIYIDYLTFWCMTTGTFFICSFAIFTKKSRESFKLLDRKIFLKLFILSFTDLFVNVGKYSSLIFLPAAIVSILKYGSQVTFLALIRRFWRKKILTNLQWFALLTVVSGLVIVSMEDFLSALSQSESEADRATIGIIILIIVGFIASARSTAEEILMQNDDDSKSLDSNFLVGMESIVSFLLMIIIGLIALCFYDPFIGAAEDYHHIGDNMDYKTGIAVLSTCFVLFLVTKGYGDTAAMRIAQLTSSLTRKLVQQLYPIGVWILSLITYYTISTSYGEGWGTYSWLRILGFGCVLVGTYLYMKPPKEDKGDKVECGGGDAVDKVGEIDKEEVEVPVIEIIRRLSRKAC